MRVARELELPYDKAEVLTDESGKPTPKPVMDNTGVSGQYTSSEGLQGDEVWGTRGTLDDADRHGRRPSRSRSRFSTTRRTRIFRLTGTRADTDSSPRIRSAQKVLHRRQEGFRPDARARQVRDLPLPRADSRREREAGGYREGVQEFAAAERHRGDDKFSLKGGAVYEAPRPRKKMAVFIRAI